MNEMVSAMMDGSVIGSELAKLFGLNARYFSHNQNAESLNKDIKIMKFKHVLLVEVPYEARQYIKEYTATPLSVSDDESDYEYVLPLTNKIKIASKLPIR